MDRVDVPAAAAKLEPATVAEQRAGPEVELDDVRRRPAGDAPPTVAEILELERIRCGAAFGRHAE